MNTSKVIKLNCPTCQKQIEYSERYPFRPFCSERCRLIDLGDWADEKHKIAGNTVYDDMLSDDLSE